MADSVFFQTPVFAGSFNPFTIGHADIVERILRIFGNVVIAVGVNEHKCTDSSPDSRINDIKSVYANNDNVIVLAYCGLTVDFASRFHNPLLVRGVRNSSEFDAETAMADTNRLISGIETLLIPSRPELACISSSMVRELMHNGFDVSRFLPSSALPREN